MRKLNSGERSLRVNKVDDARQAADVSVVVDAEILRADPAGSHHRGGLGHHQRRPADRAAAEVNDVPVVRKPVHARVLAHRRDDNAIGERQRTDRQRIEKMRHPLILTYVRFSSGPSTRRSS